MIVAENAVITKILTSTKPVRPSILIVFIYEWLLANIGSVSAGAVVFDVLEIISQQIERFTELVERIVELIERIVELIGQAV